MGLFSRTPQQETVTPSASEKELSQATEAIVGDLERRIRSADSSTRSRADQVRALPCGEQMVTEAVRRSAQG